MIICVLCVYIFYIACCRRKILKNIQSPGKTFFKIHHFELSGNIYPVWGLIFNRCNKTYYKYMK